MSNPDDLAFDDLPSRNDPRPVLAEGIDDEPVAAPTPEGDPVPGSFAFAPGILPEATAGYPETSPDISCPSARVRTLPLPKVRTVSGPFSYSEMSPGFVLVVDNAADADDPDVQSNWLGVAGAMGAATLILSPDEIDLESFNLLDLARAFKGVR